jgi:hypothetical protein
MPNSGAKRLKIDGGGEGTAAVCQHADSLTLGTVQYSRRVELPISVKAVSLHRRTSVRLRHVGRCVQNITD